MACGTLETIAAECDNSIGGVNRVWFADFDDRRSPTVTSGHVITTWGVGAIFVEYVIKPETANFEEVKTVDEKTGTNFNAQTLIVQLIKLTAAKNTQLEVLSQKRILALVLDELGTYWLLGYDKGMKVTTMSSITGTEYGNLNGYNVTLLGKGSTPILEVDSSLIASLT